jgi:hypothetical protein
MSELGFGHSTQGEEERTEPDFFDVGLVGVLGDDLLDCELSAALDVLPEPDQAEPTPTQQFDLLETVGEAISEGLFLFLGKPIAFAGPGWVFFLLLNGFHGPLFFLPTLFLFGAYSVSSSSLRSSFLAVDISCMFSSEADFMLVDRKLRFFVKRALLVLVDRNRVIVRVNRGMSLGWLRTKWFSLGLGIFLADELE